MRNILFSLRNEEADEFLNRDTISLVRPIVPQPRAIDTAGSGKHQPYAWKDGVFCLRMYPNNSTLLEHSPFGKIGDQLLMRETFATVRYSYDFETGYVDDVYDASPESIRQYIERKNHTNSIFKDFSKPYCGVIYKADGRFEEDIGERPFRWRAPVVMPAWAVRFKGRVIRSSIFSLFESVRCIEEDFKKSWDASYAKKGYGVETNPWVWCATVEKIT
jgi:hypothetical protein